MVPETEVKKAVEALKNGKVILYPTDTIWGLGCDASNAEAVQKVFEIKGRQESKALIVLIEKSDNLQTYVVRVPEIAWDIVGYAEKPLTVIYPKGKNVAANLLAEDGSIGIRIVKDEFCQKLIKYLGKPIVSTSANFSGSPSPASFKDIDRELVKLADHVVDYRRDDIKAASPSTVMKLELDGEIKILRK